MPDNSFETTILFDTNCVLCSNWVYFILRHERDSQIQFISAWSDKGTEIAAQHGMNPEDLNLTYLVVQNGVGYTKSRATFAIMKHFKMPYRAARILRVVPHQVSDIFYNLIARNRYKIFGRKESCFMPPAGQSHRFINAD